MLLHIHKLSLYLRKVLYWQGSVVAQKPVIFFLGPLVLTTVLSYGFVFRDKLSKDQNVRQLYIPENGPSEEAKARIEAEFDSTITSQLDVLSGTTFSIILVPTAQNKSILNDRFITQYIWLRQSLEGILVLFKEEWVTYSGVCYKHPAWNGLCAPDIFKLLTIHGINGYKDIKFLKFPVSEVRLPSNTTSLVELYNSLGGVDTDSQGFIVDASVAMMNFHFPYPYPEDNASDISGAASFHHDATQAAYKSKTVETPLAVTIKAWEHAMLWHLSNWQPDGIELSWFTLHNFEVELEISDRLIALVPHLLVVILIISIFSCCVADWVYSKPWLAVGGVVSALLAVSSGFGLLLIMQIRFVDIVYIAPFLIISIGVDDMFLMLAAWRKTTHLATIKERVAATFSEAAMSITITSLTDVISFSIGTFSVFPAVRYFCVYTSVSLAFCYLYQITFFGACLSFSGMREQSNRHCVTFMKIRSIEDSCSTSLWYRVFCTGGDTIHERLEKQRSISQRVLSQQEPHLSTLRQKTADLQGTPYPQSVAGLSSDDQSSSVTANSQRPLNLNKTLAYNYDVFAKHRTREAPSPKPFRKTREPLLTIFCHRFYAPFLGKKYSKIIVGISYVTYIAVAVSGWTQLAVGLNYAKLLPDDARSKVFLERYNEYFTDFSTPLEVTIHSQQAYSQLETQEKLIRFVNQLQFTYYTTSAQFWLTDFLLYLQKTRPPRQHPIRSPTFERILQYKFVHHPRYTHYADHISWSPDPGPQDPPVVEATRFLIGVRNLHYGHEQAFRNLMFSITERAPYRDLNISMYHRTFPVAEQQNAIIPSTIKTVVAATVSMLVVAFLLIPNLVCSFCVALAIISTNIGVIGFMTILSIHLDIISMITILMSVGISVDFIAHISYYFVTSLGDGAEANAERTQEVLHYLGTPILQGACSSVFGMLVLLAIPAYMIRAFVQTLLLVILLGLYHGLVLLPILLTIFLTKGSSEDSETKRTAPNPITDGTRFVGAKSVISHNSDMTDLRRKMELKASAVYPMLDAPHYNTIHFDNQKHSMFQNGMQPIGFETESNKSSSVYCSAERLEGPTQNGLYGTSHNRRMIVGVAPREQRGLQGRSKTLQHQSARNSADYFNGYESDMINPNEQKMRPSVLNTIARTGKGPHAVGNYETTEQSSDQYSEYLSYSPADPYSSQGYIHRPHQRRYQVNSAFCASSLTSPPQSSSEALSRSSGDEFIIYSSNPDDDTSTSGRIETPSNIEHNVYGIPSHGLSETQRSGQDSYANEYLEGERSVDDASVQSGSSISGKQSYCSKLEMKISPKKTPDCDKHGRFEKSKHSTGSKNMVAQKRLYNPIETSGIQKQDRPCSEGSVHSGSDSTKTYKSTTSQNCSSNQSASNASNSPVPVSNNIHHKSTDKNNQNRTSNNVGKRRNIDRIGPESTNKHMESRVSKGKQYKR